MLARLFRCVFPLTLSEPSLWGKLPCYGDFAQHNVHAQDMVSWQEWFQRYPITELDSHAVDLFSTTAKAPRHSGWLRLNIPERTRNAHAQPWCFVLPQGALRTAPHIPGNRVIAGVFANSCDQVGRLHPVVMWHSVHTNWREKLESPRHWLFWLSQLLQAHTPPYSTPQDPNKTASLRDQLMCMWREAETSLSRAPFEFLRKPLPHKSLTQTIAQASTDSQRMHRTHLESANGVKQLPWTPWPSSNEFNSEQLNDASYGFFWQQAPNGEYINAVRIALDRHTFLLRDNAS